MTPTEEIGALFEVVASCPEHVEAAHRLLIAYRVRGLAIATRPVEAVEIEHELDKLRVELLGALRALANGSPVPAVCAPTRAQESEPPW